MMENWDLEYEEDDEDDIDWWNSDVDEYDSAEDYDDFAVSNLHGQSSSKSTPGVSVKRPIKKSKTLKDNTNAKVNEKSKPIEIPQSNLKVEMKSVTLSNETKNLIMDTLRFIHGENFSFDNAEVKESTRRLSNQYWVNQGHLRVRNCYNYSNKKVIDKDKVNSLLLENLERCGFYTNHCYEALLHTNNDLEKAIKILLQAYFNQDFQTDPDLSSLKNIVDMDDELSSLKSIYDEMVEEKVPHKYWIFHLELPDLAEWYFSAGTEKYQNTVKQPKPTSSRPVCRYYTLGKCSYGPRCRFQHVKYSEEVKKHSVNDGDLRLKAKFDLEIRFPDESRYPMDVPLILLVPQHQEFSSHVCLRITHYLLKKANTCALQGTVYCYDLIDCLQNSEDVLKWLNNEDESRLTINSRASLFPSEIEENIDEEEEEDVNHDISARVGPSKPRKKVMQAVPNKDQEIINAMKSKVSNPKYQNMLIQRKKLPAWNCCAKILDQLKHHQVLVIVGDTGCGKTTQIPQFILDEWLFASAGISDRQSLNERVEIICTQPRRLSAIGVANRVAQERLERLGDVIGYQIRLESCSSPLTKLLFCTTGILLKKLETDPLLKNVTHVIVDEVHERSEESDFLLLILKDLLKVRRDIKILLMSATVNAELFSSYFHEAPMIEIPGKMYPVEELFLEDILERIDYVIDEYSKNSRRVNKTMSRQIEDMDRDLILADSFSRDVFSPNGVADEKLTVKQLFYRYRGLETKAARKTHSNYFARLRLASQVAELVRQTAAFAPWHEVYYFCSSNVTILFQDYSKQTRKTVLLLDPEKIDPELIVSVIAWIVDGDHHYPREGSILVFLPGIADIMAVNDELSAHNTLSPRTGNFIIIPLHSTISNEEQGAVFRKTPRNVRKIVLSTNIAETSITIDDCVFVIDSGKMRETRFDTNKNITSLETMWISRANAKQRKGRAGRVMPGLCIRLYTQNRHQEIFQAQPVPEIQRVALDQVILCTKILDNFKTKTILEVLGQIIEPPDKNNIETAIVRLQDVGALDDKQELTALGRHLSVLPVDVKIGKLILFGAVFCCLDSVLTIAASLSNKSPFLSPFGKREEAESAKRKFAMCNSDHITILNAYNKWLSMTSQRYPVAKRFAEDHFLSWKTLEMIGDLKHQYLDLLVDIGFAKLRPNMRKRFRGDKVLSMIQHELNENGRNYQLLSSILCASLYPNLVKILTPDKIYTIGMSGAMPKDHAAEDLRFKTKSDGYVFLHPSSVNHNVSDFISPYLIYQEKMKTSKIFIHDSTMVNAVSLVLFAGNELKIELNNGMYTVSLENGWLIFALRSLEDARMLEHMRLEFNKLLEKKIENPHLNLVDSKVGKRIISTMVHIVTKTL